MPTPRVTPQPLSLVGRRWAERFDVVRALGSGKRGATFEAIDAHDGAHVALQLLWLRGDGAWRDEAEAYLSWRHTSACGVRALGVSERQPWVALELVPNATSLRRRTLPWSDAAPYFHEVADALAAAHAVGLTHGAVSLGSVLLRGDGRAVLSDFALAYAPAPSPSQLVVSAPVEALGAVGDQRAFCRVAWQCLAGSMKAALPPSTPPHVAQALALGLESGFESIGALKEALS